MTNRIKRFYKGQYLPGIGVLVECYSNPCCITVTINYHFRNVEDWTVYKDFVYSLKRYMAFHPMISESICDGEAHLEGYRTSIRKIKSKQVQFDFTGKFRQQVNDYRTSKTLALQFVDNVVNESLKLMKDLGLETVYVSKRKPLTPDATQE